MRPEQIALRLEQFALRLEQIALRLEQFALRLEQIALRLEQFALRLEQFALRLEQIALRLEQFALRFEQIALRLEQIALRLEQIALRPCGLGRCPPRIARPSVDGHIPCRPGFGMYEASDMQGKRVASLALLVAVLAACTASPPRAMPEPVALPVKAEPAFQATSYSELPLGTMMAVRSTTAELKAQLKDHFPALASSRASLMLVEERLILSDSSPYRRIWFSYGDEATTTVHGPCSQNIYLWFIPSGELAGTYVEEQACPI